MSRFTIAECLKHFNTEDFKSLLAEEISDNARALNLDDYCTHGGTPDPEVEIDDIRYQHLDAQNIKGCFSIAFAETYFNGCRDIDIEAPFEGEGNFTLNICTGEMHVGLFNVERVLGSSGEV